MHSAVCHLSPSLFVCVGASILPLAVDSSLEKALEGGQEEASVKIVSVAETAVVSAMTVMGMIL